jgi:hypothetical protein
MIVVVVDCIVGFAVVVAIVVVAVVVVVVPHCTFVSRSQ